LALELAGLEVPGSGRYRFGSHEVKQTAFRLDGVLEPPADQPDAPLVFVEAQFQPDEAFYLRFFGEIIVYLRQYLPARPWQALVLYPQRHIERRIEAALPFLDLPNLRRVFLDELPLLESPSPKRWLVALILAQDAQIPGIVEKVQAHRATRPGDGVDWLELLETVLVYKLPHLTREEILTMFALTDIDLKQTRFYQQARSEGLVEGTEKGMERGMEKGMERGMEKGMERGIEKGRVEGEAALVSLLLERRFGPLPAATRRRIAAADADALLVYGERLLDAQNLDEVFTD
jgi:predicted transposase/invertase (TIGR01784 family)